MEKECKVRLTSSVLGGDDGMELLSTGKWSEDNGVYSVEYEEMDETGESNTVNKIVVSGDVVSVSRLGEHPSTMVFRQGKTFDTCIVTPYGKIPLSIYSRKINFVRKENGAELDLIYSFDLSGEPGSNELHLTVDY